jgi:hypothetical protein
MASQLELIRAVRERTHASVTDCRAALEVTAGDVDAAVAYLKAPAPSPKPDRAPPKFDLPDGLAGVALLDCFADAFPIYQDHREGHVWVGAPDAEALAQLEREVMKECAQPMPSSLRAFLSRWNGFAPNPSESVWECRRSERWHVLDGDEPECARAFVIGEQVDVGWLFLDFCGPAEPRVCIYRFEEEPRVLRLADSFDAFLRTWMICSFDLLELIRLADRRPHGDGVMIRA